jgi:predicted Zn finger-like uncharacterized protein
MLIKCERCSSAFNLDESLLKKDGSTVRCSVCKHVFKVFPPEPEAPEDLLEEDFSLTAMEETVALDSPSDEEEAGAGYPEKKGYSFDKAFENAMGEAIDDNLIVPDDAPAEDKVAEDTELFFEEEASDKEPATEKRHKGKGRLRIALLSLMITLLLIITGLLVFFFAPNILPDSLYTRSSTTREPLNDAGVKKLDIKDPSNGFFTSDKEGQLFIIRGTVVNTDSKARSYIQMKGDIRDEKGNVLKQETAYAGNSLTDQELKTMSFEDIKKRMNNKSGANNSNINIKQGGRVPFMIVFKEIPENSSESWAEAVGSSYDK